MQSALNDKVFCLIDICCGCASKQIGLEICTVQMGTTCMPTSVHITLISYHILILYVLCIIIVVVS